MVGSEGAGAIKGRLYDTCRETVVSASPSEPVSTNKPLLNVEALRGTDAKDRQKRNGRSGPLICVSARFKKHSRPFGKARLHQTSVQKVAIYPAFRGCRFCVEVRSVSQLSNSCRA